MDQVDRYVLGLAVLEGDRDARKILADLLEEQGERGLAQWARRSGGKDHQRLDLAIMLLPHREALWLACDFATQAATGQVPTHPMALVRYVANAAREWLLEKVDDSIFEQEVPNNLDNMGRRPDALGLMRDAQQLCDEILAATRNVVQAARCRTAGYSRLAHHWETMTKQSVRRVTRLASGRTSKIPWHLKRGIGVFRHLISPAEYPWPL